MYECICIDCLTLYYISILIKHAGRQRHFSGGQLLPYLNNIMILGRVDFWDFSLQEFNATLRFPIVGFEIYYFSLRRVDNFLVFNYGFIVVKKSANLIGIRKKDLPVKSSTDKKVELIAGRSFFLRDMSFSWLWTKEILCTCAAL